MIPENNFPFLQFLVGMVACALQAAISICKTDELGERDK